MHIVSTFFRVFFKSLTSLSYYRDVVKAPFTFSLKYFLFFSLLLGSLATFGVSSLVLPHVTVFVDRFEKRANDLYPEDLVITIKNGILTTNANDPIRFPIPFELFLEIPPAIPDSKQLYLVTLDPSFVNSETKVKNSLFYFTQNHLYISDGENSTQYSLSDFGDVKITKSGVNRFIQTIIPLLKMVPALLVVVFMLLFFIIWPILRLISLLFHTTLLLLVANLIGISLPFVKMYQIGLHSMTFSTILRTVLMAFSISPAVPLFDSVIFLLFNLAVLAELKHPQRHKSQS
ncbi:DUF1189 family protein [Candidatus Gottesmanbacteria bacterium]|nr:DUF1189 family protein [Candidatus Gottesmanbacteria bacterium]